MRTYWSNYFEHTDALVYVIDSADNKRLNERVRKIIDKFIEECDNPIQARSI